MGALGYLLFGIGCAGGFVANLKFLVIAYRYGVAWLLACLFIPFAGLVFFILHAKETWRLVLLSLAGFLVAGIGCWIGNLDFAQ